MKKLIAFIIMITSVALFAMTTRHYKSPQKNSGKSVQAQVLGAQTTNYTHNAKNMFHIAQHNLQHLLNEKIASLESDLNQVASTSAKKVTDIFYTNTIERVILELVHTLPSERQKKYTSE